MDIAELLSKLKISIGDFNAENNPLDAYYTDKLNMAYADLVSDDISEGQLNTELGKSAIVVYAKLLIDNIDIATNATLNFLKHKLSILTRGEDVGDVEQ